MAENTSAPAARQEQTGAQAASAARGGAAAQGGAYDATTQVMPLEDASRKGTESASAPYEGAPYAEAPSYTGGPAPQGAPYPNGAVPAAPSATAGKGAKKPADPRKKERRRLIAFVIVASLVCGLIGGVAGAAILNRIDGADIPAMQTPDGSGGMQMPGNGSGGMQRPGGSGTLQMPGDGPGSDSDSSGSDSTGSDSSNSGMSNSAQESLADTITA